MRGQVDEQWALFHVFDVEDRIRPDHPLRDIKRRTDDILQTLPPLFQAAYSKMGRPSVPPERLLKALLLMALDSIRSETADSSESAVSLVSGSAAGGSRVRSDPLHQESPTPRRAWTVQGVL